jgi:hypothetical protein
LEVATKTKLEMQGTIYYILDTSKQKEKPEEKYNLLSSYSEINIHNFQMEISMI